MELRFSQKRKAVSSFVVILILMVVAVAGGTILYSYSMNAVSPYNSEENRKIVEELVLDTYHIGTKNITIYVRNIGDIEVSIDKAYVDGNVVEGSGYTLEVNNPILEDTISRVNMSVPTDFQDNKAYNIRLVSNRGIPFVFVLVKRKLVRSHDIAITEIISNSTVPQGENATIIVYIQNQGPYEESASVVLENVNDSIIIGNKTYLLHAGATIDIEYQWNSANLGTYFLMANATQVPEEIDTADNIRLITIEVT